MRPPRIPRADIASANPVSVVNRDAIQLTGLTDVGNLVQRMPSMSGSPIGTTTNNGGDGSVQIDLRGMGPQRTITLVDGKRVIPTYLGGGDYQSIPQEMIDHIEVLKAGASAIYGADAVAGVVNIITRKDYDGIDVNVQNADFFNMKSGRQYNVGMIAGKTFTNGNFVFGAEYVNQDGAYQSDAPWAFFQNSYYIYPDGCEHQVTAPYNGTPQGGCYPIGSSRIPEGRLTFATQGTYMNVDGSGLVPYDGRTYNYAPVNYIQTPYQRTNLFAQGAFDLTDHVRFNAAVRGTYRASEQNGAPQPYDSRLDPAYSGVFNGQPYTGISPDNYYLVQAATAAGLTPEPVVDARRRMVETPRIFKQDITSYQFVTGLDGDFGKTSWSAFWNRGYRSGAYHDYGQFFGPFLTNAMGPSAIGSDGQLHCYGNINDPSTLIPNCVPFNFFGGPGSVTQAMLDYVGVVLNDTRTYRQDEGGVSFNGSAWKLPGGNLGWAAGAGYLGDSYAYVPDSAKAKGQVTGNKGQGTDGAVYSHNVFGEIYAPLFNNGKQSFDLRLGVRYDDYNLFGSKSTWQLGLQLQATQSLKLRATTGSVFRAPSVDELFAGQSDDFPTYSDPCVPGAGQTLPAGCAQVGVQTDNQVLSRIGGNPNLKPETGDTFSGGIVFTPGFGNGDFSLTVDYWRIKLKHGISTLGVQLILNNCYLLGDAQACSLITRRANYSVAKVIDTNLNVSDEGAKGVDTEMRYTFNTGVGDFQTSFLWSHLLKRTKVTAPGQPTIDLSGRFTDPTATDGGAYPTNKINYSVQWHRGDLSLGYLGEYISSLQADTFFNPAYKQHVAAMLYHDIVMTYDFTMGTTLAAGITNITDKAPPYLDEGFNATTDPSTYRMFGRGYYLRVSHKF